ncbi:MAG: glycoside hydrolase family 28 protein [Paludibacter sp.]|nr:glycoside hydrolase family 28 protein [Paludibacter sp.]
MKGLRKIVVVGCLVFLGSNALFSGNSKYDYLYQDLAFTMKKVQVPEFPSTEVTLSEYGGVGDGVTLNTVAFKKAIQALSEKGGGKLVVPAGIWFTGPIELKSNINLNLEKGSVILFSPDFELYPLVNIVFEGLDTRRCQSPISGKNLENVAITGEGSINGSGQAWRPLKKGKVTDSKWKELTKSGGVFKEKDYWFPSAKSLKGQLMSDMNVPNGHLTANEWNDIKDFLRPVMISFVGCKNVMLQGVLFENSPSWNIHPLMCENVIIDHVFARNPEYAQNGDGLDIESCKNVLVVNSTFDVGDDGICIKSGKDKEGRERARSTENVIVDNCKVFQGHGGFVVGSEMSGSVRNISVSNCEFLGTDVGIRFKSNRGRGGVVENIYISNIYMLNITTDSFLFDLYYGGKSASESLADNISGTIEQKVIPITEETPCFRNIYVKNLVSRNARRAMFFNGLPEMNISNINLENAIITSQYGAELVESDGVKFNNVNIIPTQGAAFILKNVKNFSATNLKYPVGLQQPFNINGVKTKNIKLPVTSDKKNLILCSEKIDTKEIKFLN